MVVAGMKQDMPPPGGYAPITYKAIPLKKGIPPQMKMAMFLGFMGVGWFFFDMTKKKQCNEKIEMRCARLALYPMVLAETDRMILKQFKRNRDAEDRIMKDVEGWETGRWKGLPVYFSVGPDEYFKPTSIEYYAHAEDKYMIIPHEIMKNN